MLYFSSALAIFHIAILSGCELKGGAKIVNVLELAVNAFSAGVQLAKTIN